MNLAITMSIWPMIISSTCISGQHEIRHDRGLHRILLQIPEKVARDRDRKKHAPMAWSRRCLHHQELWFHSAELPGHSGHISWKDDNLLGRAVCESLEFRLACADADHCAKDTIVKVFDEKSWKLGSWVYHNE